MSPASRCASPTTTSSRAASVPYVEHKEDRAPQTRECPVDPYSSALTFSGWSEAAHLTTRQVSFGPRHRLWSDLEPLPVSAPQTWLLREGWKLGGSVSLSEVPGRRYGATR